ncbi:MAG: hypothetical protein ACI9P5_002592 [Saprospiraceae bacterium]|jgi:hypothetical protein
MWLKLAVGGHLILHLVFYSRILYILHQKIDAYITKKDIFRPIF